MRVFAIDPGNEVSAWVLYDGERRRIVEFSNEATVDELLSEVRRHFRVGSTPPRLAVEMVASYGMPVGMTVFETCVAIGRIVEAAGIDYDWRVYRVQDVKMHICHDSRAKDGNIRQALIDRFGPPGTKKNPGLTYGLSGDGWSALAIAVTAAEGGIRHKTPAEQMIATAERRAKKRAKREAEKAQPPLPIDPV